MKLTSRLALACFIGLSLQTPASAGLFGKGKKNDEKKSDRTLVKAPKPSNEIAIPLREIAISGNDKVSTEVIQLAISSKAGQTFKKEKLEKDLEAIRELGYFSHVDHQIVPYQGGMKVMIRVVENPLIEHLEIQGNTLIETKDLVRALDIKLGTPLNLNKLQEGIRQVNSAYTKLGYAFCGIMSNEQFQIDPRNATLKISVVEPRLRKLTVTGNLKTLKHVITREMTLKEGKVVKVDDVKNSMRDVYNLGFFSDVSPPQPRFDFDDKSIDLTFDVKEQKTGTASFGGGYSSISGLIGFIDVAESNFRGRGQTIRGKWQFGGENSYIFSFVEPWFMGHPVSMGGSIFRTRLDREQFTNGVNLNRFREERSGFSLSSGWRIARDTRLTASFNDESIRLDQNIAPRGNAVPSLPADIAFFDLDGDGVVKFEEQTFGLNWTRDKRDNFVNAQSGNRLSLTFSTTGGILKGITGYNKYTADYRHYLPLKLFGGATLASRARGGITQVTDGTLRFIDRFSLGGGDTVRGYQDREFTGADFLMGNVELRKQFSRIFGVVGFIDAGDAFNSDGRNMDLHGAYGVGARIVTPLGPFRLDYGFPVDSGRSGRLHFGIGQSF